MYLYQTPELTTRSIDVFDGAMVVLAMYSLLFFHPGRLLFSQPDYNNDTDTVELEKNLSKTNETLA